MENNHCGKLKCISRSYFTRAPRIYFSTKKLVGNCTYVINSSWNGSKADITFECNNIIL